MEAAECQMTVANRTTNIGGFWDPRRCVTPADVRIRRPVGQIVLEGGSLVRKYVDVTGGSAIYSWAI